MASLKDIAEELGVSVSLVSKVINNKLGTTGVRDGVAEAIREKAKTLVYQRNISATALRKGRHDVIGVFVHRLGMAGSGIIQSLLDGISVEAMKANQKLLLNFFVNVDDFNQLCQMAHRGAMDGLVISGVVHKEFTNKLIEIQKSGVPVITVYDEVIHQDIPNVGIDQTEIAKTATEYLIERGCTEIVHIKNTKARFDGYQAALRDAGISMKPEWVYVAREEKAYDHIAGSNAMANFINKKISFDGVVAQSDQEAMGAINTLFRRGLSVPEDVRVIGIDNAPYCEFARIPISSVSQQFEERGVIAVKNMMKLIDGKKVKSIMVAPKLFQRRSSY